jgi:hypothetical protein
MSPLHANVSHLHQTARYPLRAWLTALGAVPVLGLLTSIQLMAAPIKVKKTRHGPGPVKVAIGKHPPKARQAAAEAERIIKHWIPVLDGWLGKKLDKPLEVRLEFVDDPKGGIAWASGATITMNLAKTLQGAHIDEGILIHELTHVLQPYKGSVPGWLVEGIADYNRWVRYEPHNCGAGPVGRESYKDGYGRAADFLGWVERHHDRKLVQAIHAAACAGKYTDDLFRKRTKKTLAQLWEEYAEAKNAPDGGRTFRLVNVRSGLALAFRGPKGKAEVTQMAVSRNQGQLWRLEKVRSDFVIVNVATKMALEVPEGSRKKGARLCAGDRLDKENQRWQVARSGQHFSLRSKLSGQYVSVLEGRRDAGAPVIQWPKHTRGDGDDQLWSIQVAD